MPSRHLIPHATCAARNAYNPSVALLTAFQLPQQRWLSQTPAHSKPNESLLETQQKLQESVFSKVATSKPLVRTHIGKDDGVKPTSKKLGVGNSFGDIDSLQQPQGAQQEELEPKQSSVKITKQFRNAGEISDIKQNRSGTFARPTYLNDSRSVRSVVLHPKKTNNLGDYWKREQQRIAKDANDLAQQRIDKEDIEEIEKRRGQLDYSPKFIDTPTSPLAEPLPVPWKLQEEDFPAANGMEVLDKEIERFARYVDITPAERTGRAAVVDKIIKLISSRDREDLVKVETFGSSKVGLETVMSDIDLRLSFHQGSNDPKKLAPRMRSLETLFQRNSDYMLVSFRHARYPIINLQHKETGIDIQIVASPSTDRQQELMSKYLTEIPHLRSVYLVLKTAFGTRGLIDVFNGGVGSYGLFMMIVAALKRPSSQPPQTPSESLLRFLSFYSDLDTARYGVSVEPPKLFKKHSVFTTSTKSHIAAARRRGDKTRAAQWAIGQTRMFQPYLLCLQDPANEVNDLGRKTNGIKHLQATIRVLWNTLERDLGSLKPGVGKAPEVWRDGSILFPIVGRCHELWFERRKRAGGYAGRVGETTEEMKEVDAALLEQEVGTAMPEEETEQLVEERKEAAEAT